MRTKKKTVEQKIQNSVLGCRSEADKLFRTLGLATEKFLSLSRVNVR